MTVHFVVYDIATGIVQRSGICQEQDLEKQAGPGEAVMRASAGITAVVEVNLDPVRAAMFDRIDAEAEQQRLRFITSGDGQAMMYLRKEAQARAFLADPDAPVPSLEKEAAATGQTVADVAAAIIARADAWAAIGDDIEATRLGAKKAVADATNIAEIHAAATVDWEAVLA